MGHILRIAMLLAALAAATACSENKASEVGWVDHNNDGHEDGGM